MSRLFVVVDSDGRKYEERVQAHEKVTIMCTWDHTKRKKLIDVEIEWRKNMIVPTVWIDTSEEIRPIIGKMEVNLNVRFRYIRKISKMGTRES